ncbi:uncharacterized protein [Nicotiana tomentosiformis]|uniref:uncharacterized protein n=1 Tax=Nicotiana tomentosiformis TaxID=4098 RepID=UPI00388CD103
MSVTDYETRFSEFSRHVLMILPTDAERVQRFITCLYSGSHATMAQEVEMGTSYELVMEISRRIEGVRQRGREQATRDKQFRYYGEFSGAPVGGRGQFPRGHTREFLPATSYSGSSSWYPDHQEQTSDQQSTILRDCYECGDHGHMKTFLSQTLGQGSVARSGTYDYTTNCPSSRSAIQRQRVGG